MSEDQPPDPVEKKKPKRKLPTLSEAKSSVQPQAPDEEKALQERFEEQFSQRSSTSEIKFLHQRGLRDHYSHKRYWSWFLMFLMLAMIAFQTLVIILVGSSIWDFTKYPWLLPALLVQNLAQIVGLAVFVVKSLFSSLAHAWE